MARESRDRIEQLDQEMANLRRQGYYVPSIPYSGRQDLDNPGAPVNSAAYREAVIEKARSAGRNPSFEAQQEVRDYAQQLAYNTAERSPASVPTGEESSSSAGRKSEYFDKDARQGLYEKINERVQDAFHENWDNTEKREYNEHIKRINELRAEADKGVVDLTREGKTDYMEYGTVDNRLTQIEEEAKAIEKLKDEQDKDDRAALEDTGFNVEGSMTQEEQDQLRDILNQRTGGSADYLGVDELDPRAVDQDTSVDDSERATQDDFRFYEHPGVQDPEKKSSDILKEIIKGNKPSDLKFLTEGIDEDKDESIFGGDSSGKINRGQLLALLGLRTLDQGVKDYARVRSSEGDPYAAMFGSNYRVGDQGFERPRNPLGATNALLRVSAISDDPDTRKLSRALLGGKLKAGAKDEYEVPAAVTDARDESMSLLDRLLAENVFKFKGDF